MIPLSVTSNLDLDPWVDLTADRTPHNTGGRMATVARVGILPAGTQSGRATVAFAITLPNGKVVLAETTLRLFRAASAAILASPAAQMEDL